MNCILCGSSNNKIIYNYTRFEKNNILQCLDCELVFLETTQSKEDISDFYSNGYRTQTNNPILSPDALFRDPIVQQDCRDCLEWLQSIYGGLKDKKVVEIGSASGSFLATLKEAGAIAIGVEPNIEQTSYSRGLGLDIVSSFEAINFENLDCVVMFHTLEHIMDPIPLVKSIYSSLKPGGKLIGEVPNQDDWRISIFDYDVAKRLHYDPSHYYYYSSLTLYKLLHNSFYSKSIELSTVERYNSFRQLREILADRWATIPIETALRHYIFSKPESDVRLKPSLLYEVEFNRLFSAGVNSEYKGNCLRWVATK